MYPERMVIASAGVAHEELVERLVPSANAGR
jgi:hypothetical protein